MTLSIKNGRYAFLIRLDLMFSISLWKEFQLLEILKDLFYKHLIKLILYENDVKFCIGRFVISLKCEILIIDTGNEYINRGKRMVQLFFYRKFNVRMHII